MKPEQHKLILEAVDILIVEDLEIVGISMSSLLQAATKGNITMVKSGEEAMGLLEEGKEYDIILMDLWLEKTPNGYTEPKGLEISKKIIKLSKRNKRKNRIIIISVEEDGRYIKNAFNSGIKGYLFKRNCTEQKLFKTIHCVHNGKIYYRDEERDSMDEYQEELDFTEEKPYLTPAEMKVIRLVEKGFTSEDISKHLKIKESTVETHKSNMFKKLGATNAPNLISLAYQYDLLKN